MGIQLSIATMVGFPPTDVYAIVDRVDYSRASRTLVIWVAGFPSKAVRDNRKAAQLKMLDLVKSLPSMPNPENFTDREVFDSALRDYEQARAAIQRELRVTQGEAKGPAPIALPGVTVPPQEVAGLLGDDGMPNVKRCYEWLSVRPEFAAGQKA